MTRSSLVPATRGLLCCLSLCTALPVAADTLYKCKDSTGIVLYTNQKGSAKNCIVLSRDLPSTTTVATPRRTTAAAGNSPARATPASFPRVDSHTQRSRDDERRQILEEELGREQRALNASRQDLQTRQGSAAATDTAELRQLRNGVGLHERNIAALQKEIANLR